MLVNISRAEKDFLDCVSGWVADIKRQFELRYGQNDGACFDNDAWLPHHLNNYKFPMYFKGQRSSEGIDKPSIKNGDIWLNITKCICFKALLTDKKSYRPAAIITACRQLSEYLGETGQNPWELTASDLQLFCLNGGVQDWAWPTVKAIHLELSIRGVWNFRYNSPIPEKSTKKRYKDDSEVEDLRERVICLLKLYDQIDSKREDGTNLFVELEQMAICFMMLCFAAPVRYNEVISLTVDALLNVQDYAKASTRSSDETYPYWVLFERGSKGAESKAKVVIAQMIETARDCFKRITQMNAKRRAFVAHYESNPSTLFLTNGVGKEDFYLIEELELLGVANSKRGAKNLYSNTGFANLVDKKYRYLNTGIRGEDGRFIYEKINNYHRVSAKGAKGGRMVFPCDKILSIWMTEFQKEMDVCLRQLSTPKTTYKRKLHEALFLSPDSHSTRFAALPSVPSNMGTFFGKNVDNNLFAKAGITYIDKSGKLATPTISSHEIRHWLTNEARRSNKLSDDLVNLWTGRKDINQLSAYQHLSEEERAELLDIPTSAFHQIAVKTDVGDSGSFALQVRPQRDEMLNTLELLRERHFVQTSNDNGQVVNVTPWGWCSHETYELPCIKLKQSKCVGCGDLWVVKGDSKSNEYLFDKNEKSKEMMLAQAKYLLKNRHLYPDDERLVMHIQQLVDKYARNFDRAHLDEISDFILDNFEQIKGISENASLSSVADTAWIIRGFCRLIVDPSVEVGAGIRYEGRDRYYGAELPGITRALSEHGVDTKALLKESPILFMRRSDEKS
ncbi:MAG: hypothetical protein U1D54_13825 [Limnobacter sp.]|nr:hypothetical protein [Limnobacter sp.]